MVSMVLSRGLIPARSTKQRIRSLTIDLWCNGNTADFGSVIRGSNPRGSTNGSYICTKSCVIQVLVRKRKTNYGDSYHKELEETDRILLAQGDPIC